MEDACYELIQRWVYSRKLETCRCIILPYNSFLSCLYIRHSVATDLSRKTDEVMYWHSVFVIDISCMTVPSKFYEQSKCGAQTRSVALQSESICREDVK